MMQSPSGDSHQLNTNRVYAVGKAARSGPSRIALVAAQGLALAAAFAPFSCHSWIPVGSCRQTHLLRERRNSPGYGVSNDGSVVM
ncbi:hypothetical protein BAUCODRAFT_124426 [Baudoinia panamericana UAMH 10762]|uniref:Uncharacterized protein n=1 Tax=Baudoinia panamericana (strain UAMH 10762) TaxID=717646 RepID=M2LKM7_BAUPA|nr:uncharacterized protein BAUCODRAFT_124426 [Baudoinia panamericana UAMH 10762]EMC94837.1 hypothetical protein BAUCODRAFT_124426 [Baudoinia panamericana UAMH 10762]